MESGRKGQDGEMMTCEEFRALTSRDVSAVAEAERAGVRQHLEGCKDCRRWWVTDRPRKAVVKNKGK